MSPKILLIADVGTNSDGFYHVGDEAMLYQTVQWYHQQYPKIKLGVVARSKSYAGFGVAEHPHLPFPYADFWLASPWYCFHLIIRVVIHRFSGLPVLKKRELVFISFVRRFDVLHFTGGGNIYSHHVPWLYYVFFLLFLGKFFRKKIWLTSQTLGPFNFFDGILAKIFLQLSDVLVLRSQRQALQWKTTVGLDAAYDLPILPKSVLPKKPAETLRIGLSVHEWQNFGPKLSQTIAAALEQLAKKQKLELVLLPHVFTRNESVWDPGFMAVITQQLSPSIKITAVRPQQILNAADPTVYIKSITAELDLLIATRYHGLVFALSRAVPAVTFNLDEYYDVKNTELLALVYEENWQRFVVDLESADAAKKLSKTMAVLYRNLVNEKQLLKENNLRLHNNASLFALAPLVEALGD